MIIEIFPNRIEISPDTQEEWAVIEGETPVRVIEGKGVKLKSVWFGDTEPLNMMRHGLVIMWITLNPLRCMICGEIEYNEEKTDVGLHVCEKCKFKRGE